MRTVAESLFEADDRKRLTELQKRWAGEFQFFSEANEYLNLVPKDMQTQKGDPRIKKLLVEMSERLHARKQSRQKVEKLGFFASIAASFAAKRKIKALKKKLKAPKVEAGTEYVCFCALCAVCVCVCFGVRTMWLVCVFRAANVGGGVFNAQAQLAAASYVAPSLPLVLIACALPQPVTDEW